MNKCNGSKLFKVCGTSALKHLPGYFPCLMLLTSLALPFSPGSQAATFEDARAAARLYSAAFDREPKPDGLNFWINSIDRGQSLLQISEQFRNSPEFAKKYGALDNTRFVQLLYRNILGREGAQAGIAFWLEKLESGTSPALVLRQFSESPENRRKTDDLFAEMHRSADGTWSYDPVSGPVKSVGTINGFGSIFVNGVEFETDDAAITLDGQPSSEDALRLGMVVTVAGVINEDGTTGRAEQVLFDDEVQGPVTAIVPGQDGDTLLLTILGLEVIVERTGTVFDDVDFESLAVEDLVEVSGFFDEQGRLRATRVEKKTGDEAISGEVELKGNVSGLTGTEFMLGAYLVDFSGADLSDTSGGILTEGMSVEVHGHLAAGKIVADRVEEEDGVGGAFENDDEVSVEGAITQFVSKAQFEVNGVSVDGINAILRPSDIVLTDGVVVQVEGNWEAGILVARKIESRRGRVEIETSVAGVDVDEGTIILQLYGVATLNVLVDTRTLLDDDSDDDNGTLTAGDIVIGDFLEVEAFQSASTLVATRIDRDEPEDETLQAPVEGYVAGQSVTMLGITYSTDGAEFESRAGTTISSEQFYGELQVGDLVKVKDRSPADGIADSVEFERSHALDGDDCESDDDCDADDDDCESDDDCDADDDDCESDDCDADDDDDSDDDDSDDDDSDDDDDEEEDD